MSNGSVMIMLDLGPVDDEEIKSSDSLKNAYDELNSSLEKFKNVEKPTLKIGRLDVKYYSDSHILKISNRNESRMSSILASLCTQMAEDNPAYEWMNNEHKIDEITSIRDEFNKKGYNITFKSDGDDYRLTLVKI